MLITLLAYAIDRLFGEFSFIKDPVIYMGDYIKWFEMHYYKNSIKNGSFLTLSLIFLVLLIIYTVTITIEQLSNIYVQSTLLAIIASTYLMTQFKKSNTS